MRTIESKIRLHFFNRDPKDISKRDKVTVVNGTTTYRLWGHAVAKIENGKLFVRDAGYQTLTTKSRINAILYGTGWSVYQKDFTWYLYKDKKTYSWEPREWNLIPNPYKIRPSLAFQIVKNPAKKARR